MIKERTLSANEITTLVENCVIGNGENWCEKHCPLFAECLYNYTGDDSALKEREENR